MHENIELSKKEKLEHKELNEKHERKTLEEIENKLKNM